MVDPGVGEGWALISMDGERGQVQKEHSAPAVSLVFE